LQALDGRLSMRSEARRQADSGRADFERWMPREDWDIIDKRLFYRLFYRSRFV
jgi:hypothetical protein